MFLIMHSFNKFRMFPTENGAFKKMKSLLKQLKFCMFPCIFEIQRSLSLVPLFVERNKGLLLELGVFQNFPTTFFY